MNFHSSSHLPNIEKKVPTNSILIRDSLNILRLSKIVKHQTIDQMINYSATMSEIGSRVKMQCNACKTSLLINPTVPPSAISILAMSLGSL
jgi:hypothetical protein